MRLHRGVMSIALLIVPAAVAAVVPVTVGPRGLEAAEALCQDGTCCPEEGSTCVVGDIQRPNKYYKSSGSCKDPTQPAPPP